MIEMGEIVLIILFLCVLFFLINNQADLNTDGDCAEFIAAEAQLKEAEEQMKVE